MIKNDMRILRNISIQEKEYKSCIDRYKNLFTTTNKERKKLHDIIIDTRVHPSFLNNVSPADEMAVRISLRNMYSRQFGRYILRQNPHKSSNRLIPYPYKHSLIATKRILREHVLLEVNKKLKPLRHKKGSFLFDCDIASCNSTILLNNSHKSMPLLRTIQSVWLYYREEWDKINTHHDIPFDKKYIKPIHYSLFYGAGPKVMEREAIDSEDLRRIKIYSHFVHNSSLGMEIKNVITKLYSTFNGTHQEFITSLSQDFTKIELYIVAKTTLAFLEKTGGLVKPISHQHDGIIFLSSSVCTIKDHEKMINNISSALSLYDLKLAYPFSFTLKIF